MKMKLLGLLLVLFVACNNDEDEMFKYYNLSQSVNGYRLKLKPEYLPRGDEYSELPTELTIPSQYKGQPVVGIADSAFYGCTKLSYITFPQTAQYIGNCAFLGCSSLKNVIIMNGITSVGDNAFAYCDSLETLTLQNSVSSLGNYSFLHCVNLSKVVFSKGLKQIGIGAFRDCAKLERIILPDSLNFIDKEAFINAGIKEVQVEGAVPPLLEKMAFHQNELIPDSLIIYVPEGFEPIYRMAWSEYMDHIVDKSIPSDLREVHTKYFNFTLNNECTGYLIGLKPIYFTEQSDTLPEEMILPTYYGGLPVIGIAEGGFSCSDDEKTMVVADGTTRILDNHNVNIKSIIFPERMKLVSDRAFEDSKISTFILSDSLEQIAYCAFKGSSVTQIRIPEHVSIGDFAFCQCTSLMNVHIMGGVTMGNGVFDQCYNLKNVIFPSSMPRIAKGAFRGCRSLQKVSFAKDLKVIESGAFEECHSLENIVIPAGIDTIGNAAFRGCQNLSSFTIEKQQPPVIQKDVFGKFSQGMKIYVPTGSGSIYKISENWSNYAAIIQDPEAIEDKILEEEKPEKQETSVGFFVLNLVDGQKGYSLSLKKIYSAEGMQMAEMPTDVIIPTLYNGLPVIKINDNAFKACGVSTIVLPENLKTIGKYAFVYCSSLTSIVMKAATPPSLGNNALNNTPSSLKIYVPKASLKAYKSAKGWSKFANKIEVIVEEEVEKETQEGGIAE